MMMIMIALSMLITLSSLTIMAMNPLAMGILILMMSLTLTMVYAFMMSSWIAFLTFLIYVSGMLVMFAYFVSLTPNQHINLSLMIPMALVTISMSTLMYKLNYMPSPSTLYYKFLNTFYIMDNIYLLMLLALILLFAMVVVVKLVTNNKGPLRPFMKYV